MRWTSRSEPRLGLGGLIATLLLTLNRFAVAYQLDPNSTSSIKSIAKDIAEDLVSMYNGNQPGGTPGLLPEPYYWWYAGAMMGTLIDFWAYTGDDDYVDLTKQALLFQVGDHNDYMPINQTRTEGNDDQGFWGLAVMSAAEYNFPHPEADQPQWLALAQAVFNTQAARWDTEHCDGGLRWQIFQACFFALGARLALFTGNSTYADWAETTWDWMEKVEFIDPKSWYVYDGSHIGNNCKKIVPYQFSYNAGGFILGAAAMYNFTEDQVWKDRLDNLLDGVKIFFGGPEKNIMTEVACEPVKRCNLDQKSFKAYLSRWLAVTTQWAPHTKDFIMPLLRKSAVAATNVCTGGDNKRMCGLYWTKNKFEGDVSVGQQMAALEVTLSCMIEDRPAPLTQDTGGTSKGDPGGGSEDIGRTTPEIDWDPLPAGDKAGAAILTVLILGGFLAGMFWIFLDETSDKGPVHQVKDVSSSTAAAITALAAGGGLAAALGRKREKDHVHEKNGTVVHMSSDSSSRGSGDKNLATNQPPVLIGAVRNETHSHHRRVSSMPLGWPHNPTMRGSGMYDSDGIHSVSARQSRGDWATDDLGESSSGPSSSNEGNKGHAQYESPVEGAISLSGETREGYEGNGKAPTTIQPADDVAHSQSSSLGDGMSTAISTEQVHAPVREDVSPMEEPTRRAEDVGTSQKDKPSSSETIGIAH
ncbi:Mannan endo-16-alpha-mannosidase DCW1 [Fusarium albosuccineum]|uniref:mannan endo-1,6-alpha-mannosidase n=1 Tax=Fusarium albosuccineum TaxID=1237068 RepID=A0A8H4PH57_9HYPO|nr:Mannan endo-16-alpha-mannosidase DCW1 [Fusarium albosuccineum]